MIPLKCRRDFTEDFLVYKLLNGFTDSPELAELLKLIPFSVPKIATRNFRCFYTETQVKNVIISTEC